MQYRMYLLARAPSVNLLGAMYAVTAVDLSFSIFFFLSWSRFVFLASGVSPGDLSFRLLLCTASLYSNLICCRCWSLSCFFQCFLLSLGLLVRFLRDGCIALTLLVMRNSFASVIGMIFHWALVRLSWSIVSPSSHFHCTVCASWTAVTIPSCHASSVSRVPSLRSISILTPLRYMEVVAQCGMCSSGFFCFFCW